RPRRGGCRAAGRERGVGARRAAGGRLARLRAQGRQDRRPGERLRERGKAGGVARHRDRSPGRPVGGRGRRGRRRRPAPRRPRARSAGRARPRRGVQGGVDARGGRGDRAGAPRAARARRGSRARGAERGRGLRRPMVAGPRGRLRHRREPRAPDQRVGALDGRARARDVPEAGDDAAPHARGARAHPADRRGARNRGRHARTHRGGAAVRLRALAPEFKPYTWAMPTDEVAQLAGIDQAQVIRFDQNTSPQPLPSSRPGTIAKALAGINNYPPGGYKELHRAIADYNGVAPENVTIGLGADDLILLCARSFAGPGDRIAIEPARTYPLYRMATLLAGAEVGDDDPVLTFTCRPNSPLGEMPDLPEARPLVVDEAYYEYCGETSLPLIGSGDVIVLRTLSKAFALAGARVG